VALNINYQGDVTNSNGDDTNCKYQAFVPSINKWSNVRDTEDFQYNVNFGDGDLKTQSGSVVNGEVILVAFWSGADTRNVELNQFSVIKFTYSGVDSTVQNVQILPPHMPSCSFGLQDDGYVGVAVSASSYASLVYQWEHSGHLHFQRKTWHSGTIFDFLSIIDDKFLFDTEYSTHTSFTYTSSGDYTVSHRVINSYDLQAVCEKPIRIKYGQPSPTISFSPNPLLIGDDLTVTDTVIDTYTRITSIEHIFDGASIETNTDSPFVYVEHITVYKNYVARMAIHWNDGFDDQVLTISASPTMLNQPPEITLTVTEDNSVSGLQQAVITTFDHEGDVVSVTWQIEYLNTGSNLPDPYFICNSDTEGDVFVNIYTQSMEPRITDLDLLFAIQGTYRITVTAFDEEGLSASASQTIVVDEVCLTSASDCDELIDAAIEAYEREHQLRLVELQAEETQCRVVIVQDGLADSTGVGKVYGEFEGKEIKGIATGSESGVGIAYGEFEKKDISIDTSGAMDGRPAAIDTGGSSNSGSIVGS
jgi:hypothetical protein